MLCGSLSGPSGIEGEEKGLPKPRKPRSKPSTHDPTKKPSSGTSSVGLGRKRDPDRQVLVAKLEKKFNRYFNTVTSTNLGAGDEDRFRDHRSQSTYGYLTFSGTDDMLTGIETKGKVFYDLGSGVGKPLVAAVMLFPKLKRAVGIELSKGRHDQGTMVLKEIKDKNIKAKVVLVQGSMLDAELSESDIIYISSLCFSTEFLKKLASHLNSSLKQGTIVLTSKALPLPRGVLVSRPIVAMSWNSTHQLYHYKIIQPKS